MRATRLDRRWAQQPQYAALIDRSNPLTAGMDMCFIPAGRQRNLAKPNSPFIHGDGAALVASSVHKGIVRKATTGQGMSSLDPINGSVDFTIMTGVLFRSFAGGTFGAGSGSGAVVYGQRRLDGDVSPTLCASNQSFSGSNGTDLKLFWGTDSSGTAYGVNSSSVVATYVPYVLTGRCNGNSAGGTVYGLSLFVNGTDDGVTPVSTAGGYNQSWTGDTAYMQAAPQWGGQDAEIETLFFFRWRRSLSDREIKLLSDNPWQVFQPRQVGFFGVAVAAAQFLRPASDISAGPWLPLVDQIQAAFFVPKRRRVTQPQQQARIDWSNPISKGLGLFFVPALKAPRDMTGKVKLSYIEGTAAISVTSSGPGRALSFDGQPTSSGGGSGSAFVRCEPMPPNLTKGMTMMVWVKPRQLNTALYLTGLLGGYNTDISGPTLRFNGYPSGPDQYLEGLVAGAAGGGSSITDSAPAVMNVPIMAFLTWDGTTAFLYKDGVEIGQTGFSSAMGGSSVFELGDDYIDPSNNSDAGGNRGMVGDFYACGMWGRCLSAAEVGSLTKNLWQLCTTKTVRPRALPAAVAGSNLYAGISEVAADETDYDQTPSTGAMVVKLGPGTDPGTDSEHKVRYKIKGTGGLVVSLMQGATVIASWTHNSAPADYATYSQTVADVDAANISDYTDLRLKFEAIRSELADAPESLTLGVTTSVTQDLTWSAPSAGETPTYYQIEFREASGDWGVFGTTTDLFATVTGLVGGNTYYYRIRAGTNGGVSPSGNVESASTPNGELSIAEFILTDIDMTDAGFDTYIVYRGGISSPRGSKGSRISSGPSHYGGAAYNNTAGSPITISYSDATGGSANPAGDNVDTGVPYGGSWNPGPGPAESGMSFEVDADASIHKARVWVLTYPTTANVRATLLDGSAVPVDLTITRGGYTFVGVEVTFKAGSAGQSLLIEVFDTAGGGALAVAAFDPATDGFDRADDSDLGPLWLQPITGTGIVGGKAKGVGINTRHIRNQTNSLFVEGDLNAQDLSAFSGLTFWGDGTDQNYFGCSVFTGGTVNFFVIASGSYGGSIGSSSGGLVTASVSSKLRVELEPNGVGNHFDMIALLDGVEVLRVTDLSFTAYGPYAGFSLSDPDDTLDNFDAN